MVGQIERREDSGFHYFYIVVGFLNLVSFAVVLTPILFKRMRRLSFLRILTMISLCDTLCAISLMLNAGRPADVDSYRNNSLCQAQGFLTSYFINASVSWTVALSVQLYTITKYSKPFFSELSMHLVFWTVPLIFALLPIFAGASFGMDDYDLEVSV